MSESMPESKGEGTGATRGPLLRRVGVYAAVILAAFLLGLVPMWLRARGREAALEGARRELRLCRIQGSLASAAILSRRGEYEEARRSASDFFTSLREQQDAPAGESALPQSLRERLGPVMAQRDELITLLARGDPASADRLSDVYAAFRAAGTPAQGQGR